MADIRLISILPQAPVKGAAIAQGTAGNNSSPGLAGIENGTTLSGFIINRDAGGNPVLRTESGDITFASNFFLKIGSEVTIRVDTGTGQSLARILTVDGQPPELAEQTSSFAKQPEVVVTSHYKPPSALVSLNASVPASLPEGEAENTITVFGTLIKPQGQPATATTAATPQLPPGTHLTLKLVSVEAPAAPPQAPGAAATSPQAPASAPVTTASYAAYARALGTPAPAQPQATPETPAQAPTTQSPTPAAQSATTPPSVPASPALPLTTASAAPAAPVSQNVTPPVTPPATPAANTTAAPVQNQPLPASPPVATTPAAVQNTPPNVPIQPQTAPVTLQTPPVTAQSLPLSTATTPPPIATPLPTGTPAATVQAPQISAQLPPAPYVGQTVAAQVLGHETTGEALLQTPLGVVRLQPETALPTGSNLTLQVLQTTPPALSSLNITTQGQTVSTQPAPLLELAQGWTSLQQIFDLLSARFSLLGSESPPMMLPGLPTSAAAMANTGFTPKDIGPGLLLFITALRGGDFRTWLGKENIRWLEDSGQGNLIKKAEREFGSIATQYAEAKPGHWQALFFPIAVDGIPQQVRLFTKRDRERSKNEQEAKGEDTRFVIEVDLTQLGEIQMDGFVRKMAKEVNFDLMIRSLQPLDAKVQQDILAIYNATGAITGYKGSLAFQAVREFPVNPMEDIVAGHKAVTA